MVRSFTRLVPVLAALCLGTSRLSSALPSPAASDDIASLLLARQSADSSSASGINSNNTADCTNCTNLGNYDDPIPVSSSDPVVQVRNGSYAGITIAPIAAETTLSGFGTNGTQEAFLGIPYAQQPVDEAAGAGEPEAERGDGQVPVGDVGKARGLDVGLELLAVLGLVHEVLQVLVLVEVAAVDGHRFQALVVEQPPDAGSRGAVGFAGGLGDQLRSLQQQADEAAKKAKDQRPATLYKDFVALADEMQKKIIESGGIVRAYARDFDPVINSLPAFAGYFATAIGLLAVFILLYVFVTPYNEMALIREGNTAAAISLGGAMVGYAGPWVLIPGNHDAALAESVWTRAQRLDRKSVV